MPGTQGMSLRYGMVFIYFIIIVIIVVVVWFLKTQFFCIALDVLELVL